MRRIRWALEESIVLTDAYIRNGKKIPLPDEETTRISLLFNQRAKILGFDVDEKFRNKNGLNMQSACIHYVFTDGTEGLSNANDLFYKAHDLFMNDQEKFYELLNAFYEKYSI